MKKLCALFLSAIMSVSTLSFCSVSALAQEDTSAAKAVSELDEEKTASNDTELLAASVPAFPGAEGGGKYATGGRGGKVVYVTNLNDSGAGSFRDAVGGSNRIVVFKVGGTIELKSDVVVKGNVTIAGQTAPGGGGITLKNYKIGFGGDNIICRFISSRPGERGTSADYDAWGGSNGANSIVDHCSLGWANDEQWGLYSNNDYNTVQWTLIGPSNSFSYHSKGIHGFAIMFGRSNNTFHHNMIAHNVSRNFRGKVVGTNTAEFVNNVIYNWGYQTAYGTIAHINYVGNYLKAGNGTSGSYHYMSVPSSGTDPQNYKIYLTGNKIVNKDGSVRNDTNNNWSAMDLRNTTTYPESVLRSDTPFKITLNNEDVAYASKAESADAAFENVINYAGAGVSADKRPAIDQQVMYEAKTGTGNMTGARPYAEANATQKAEIEKSNIQCGTQYVYPAAVTSGAPLDSDEDGMPDEWETKRGLNPYSKYDENGNLESSQDYCGQGYTNIEYYLNDLTVDAFPEGTVTLSPTVINTVYVDANAPETSNGTISRKTVSGAIKYLEENSSQSSYGNRIIEIAPGTYNEDVTIGLSDVVLTLKEDTTGDVNIVGKLTVSNGAENFKASNISFGSASSDYGISVSADKAVFEDCSAYGKVNSVVLNNDIRAYFKDCKISGSDNVISGKARAVFEGCTVSVNGSGAVASLGMVNGNKYGYLFMNSTIKGADGQKASLGNADGSYSQIIYWNCKMGNIAEGASRWTNTDSSKKDDIRFMECNSYDLNGNAINLSAVAPDYEIILSEATLLEEYNPFNHLRARYNQTEDKWNPGGFDETTPQENLQALADSIKVSSKVITKDTKVVTYFESDSEAKITWTTSNSEKFKDNTIIVGEYGEGVTTITLTATISKEGLKDIVKTFTVLVGSKTLDAGNTVDFSDEAVGSESSYLVMTSDYELKDNLDKISWGITDNIDGTKYADRGNFFAVNQKAATVLDETVSAGKGIYDFAYDFGEQKEKVIEVSFDVYTGDIDSGGYFETYVRGGKTIGQLRHTADSVDFYDDTEKITSTIGNAWYTFKVVIDTVGITSGTAPKVSYFMYDEDGNLVKSVKNATYANATKNVYTVDTASSYMPNKLVFRPNRNYNKCEFYVDNILFRDITSIAEADAKALSVGTMNMSGTDRLPIYGNHLSTVKWRVVDGANNLVNSDGTINYSLCKNVTVKVKGTVTTDDGFASVDTDTITLNITGTGTENPIVSDKYFSDTNSFTSWNSQLNQSSNIALDDTEDVSGNTSVKIKIANKAVFKTFENPVGAGKVRFTADVLSSAAAANTTGRTFRIYFENAQTANANGSATEEFATTNIFYHLMDVSNNVRVVTDDIHNASTEVGSAVGKIDGNKWYRIVVDTDFDEGTAVTSVYLHGTDGQYAPNNVSSIPIGTSTTKFIPKTPLKLSQIRLVRTAESVVYFDNISLSEIKENQGEEEYTYGDVDKDGSITANDASTVLQYVLNKDSVKLTDEQLICAKVNGEGYVTAKDAASILQKALNAAFEFLVK